MCAGFSVRQASLTAFWICSRAAAGRMSVARDLGDYWADPLTLLGVNGRALIE